ncbi:MAG: hypothetical protein JO115_03415 [Pseudonocardiales bacterium]|jgi:hypothetical protein|nr:hypothetical protein [Pseudonocardiales bacterium]
MESCRARGKPGPKPKGDRTATIVYLPTEFRRQAAEIAHRDGLPLTAVITRAVAQYLGEPAPRYCEPKTTDQQPELPLDRAS